MRGQDVVELGRERLERGQPRPQHAREVVVLVVVADVVRKHVQGPVVRVRLLREAVLQAVLRDEVPRERVERVREEGREHEVRERARALRLCHEAVEGELDDKVDAVPHLRRLRAHEARAEGVEEDLEGREDDLA
jgi:hypothetical protein